MHIDPSPAFVVHCVHTTAASPTRGEAILTLVRFTPQGGREFQLSNVFKINPVHKKTEP